MEKEHRIVKEVYAAQKDEEAEERFIRQYLPYIKAEASKSMHRMAGEDDDEVSIAMFAFHEAVRGYRKEKGAFLSYASVLIRNRIIDYYRKEKKHLETGSIEESEVTVLEQAQYGRNDIEEYSESRAAKEELQEFSRQLTAYDLTLSDIVDNCPKQERTLHACHRALAYVKGEQEILDSFLASRRIPMKRLSAGAGVERKTLERHRKYMAALLLAYTNGFDRIRGHLKQILPKEGRDGI